YPLPHRGALAVWWERYGQPRLIPFRGAILGVWLDVILQTIEGWLRHEPVDGQYKVRRGLGGPLSPHGAPKVFQTGLTSVVESPPEPECVVSSLLSWRIPVAVNAASTSKFQRLA